MFKAIGVFPDHPVDRVNQMNFGQKVCLGRHGAGYCIRMIAQPKFDTRQQKGVVITRADRVFDKRRAIKYIPRRGRKRGVPDFIRTDARMDIQKIAEVKYSFGCRKARAALIKVNLLKLYIGHVNANPHLKKHV